MWTLSLLLYKYGITIPTSVILGLAMWALLGGTKNYSPLGLGVWLYHQRVH